MVFTTLTLSQMSHVLAIRSGNESLLVVGPLSNKPLLGAVALTSVLQLLAIAVALSTIVFWAVEVEKWLARRNNPHKGPGAGVRVR